MNFLEQVEKLICLCMRIELVVCFFAAIAIWTTSYLLDIAQSRYPAVCDHTYEVAWDCAVKSFRKKG